MSKDNGAGNNNFLMLSRKLLSNELWRERRVFSKAEAWIDILFTVRYSQEPERVNIGYQKFICHRGESLKSTETWAMRWGWSKSKVVRFFGMLKKRNMIETQSETVTTRLTVCNYKLYNKLRNANETQVKRKPERKRNASETQAETEEESKIDNKDKKVKKTTTPKLSLTETQLNLIELLKSKILENNPGAKISDTYQNTWGKDLEKMMRLDGRTADQVRAVILWSQASDFWCSNIMSFDKLRKQFDKLTMQMKRGGNHGYSDPEKHKRGF